MKEEKPYIHECGDLVIPIHCPERYKWWKNRDYCPEGRINAPYLRLDEILEELKAPSPVWERYTNRPYRGDHCVEEE